MPQALRLSVSFASFFNSTHDNICDQVAACYTNNFCFKLINYRFFHSSILAHLAIHFASQTFCCFGLVLVHVWSIEQPLGWTAASQHAAITATMLQLHSPEEQSSLRAVLSGRNPATVEIYNTLSKMGDSEILHNNCCRISSINTTSWSM